MTGRPRRLHVGCGPRVAPGWVNADRRALPGVDLVGDLTAGLALPERAVDYAVANHLLQDLPLPDIVPVLRELRRVLADGGALRLAVPDLERAVAAYARGDGAWFYVPDAHARRPGAKLVTQIVWYGSVRTPFTWDFALECCETAGFARVVRCAAHETTTPWPEITAFDDRERETLFVEAWR